MKSSTNKDHLPKTKYSDSELAEFKLIIDEKLGEAKSQMDFYQTQLKESSNNPDSKLKGLDDGVSTRQTERLLIMASRQRKHIQHLENALLRIQNKVYGICRETGNLISKDRLKAVPHATLSIHAKNKR